MHHFSWLYLNFYSKSLLITIICEIGFLQIPRSLKKWLETENKLLIHATCNRSERCVLKFIPKPEDFTRVTELAQTTHSVFDQYILLLLVFKTLNDFNFFKGSLRHWFITANICCCTSFPFVQSWYFEYQCLSQSFTKPRLFYNEYLLLHLVFDIKCWPL